ncbi:hypothetical protein L1987_29361 [Smallanthus sonchifolius]|uniref:Uncharacterized protein n=1 Tax=Smallanthus sonchifolius TaxID=185202 RepID=A0ACB9I0D5_9ASTR|nr:hypothetical protein L1987_29361 [Smallanthus sonchifolius]
MLCCDRMRSLCWVDLWTNHLAEDSEELQFYNPSTVLTAEPDVVEVGDVETKSPERPVYARSTLNQMTQETHGLEHDIETKCSGDEDSGSKELGQ